MHLEKPVTVKTYEALHKRIYFDQKQKNIYYAFRMGYEGEWEFGQILEEKDIPHALVYDSELENGITTQLDFVVITSHRIYLLDIKNHSGIYHYEKGDFFKNGEKSNNPLTQLNRAYDVLDILLRRKNIKLPIEKKVIFINPTFTLYGNEPDFPIILRSQLDDYLAKIKLQASEINDYHHKIAAYIKSCKVNRTHIDTKISYTYESMAKGIWCDNCHSDKMQDRHKYFSCMNCQQFELKSDIVTKSAREFYLLFPNEKLTSSKLRDWCGNRVSRKLTGKVLTKNQCK